MALCLLGGSAVVRVALTVFTLTWLHSVERTPWEETWRLTDTGLKLEKVRVKGSGAGMDPSPAAVWEDGWFVWRPEQVWRKPLVLRRSSATGDWVLCSSEYGCRTLGYLVGEDADVVTLIRCH